MRKTHELYLRVREADEADFGKPIIRIHENNTPQGIKRNDHVDISLDRKNWVTRRLEPAGENGTGYIYMDIHTRGLLNRHTIGIPIAKVYEPCNFYIRKASRWRTIIFPLILVIVIAVIIYIVYSLDLL